MLHCYVDCTIADFFDNLSSTCKVKGMKGLKTCMKVHNCPDTANGIDQLIFKYTGAIFNWHVYYTHLYTN